MNRVPLRDTNGVCQLVCNVAGDLVDLSLDIVLNLVPLVGDLIKEAIVFVVIVGGSAAIGVEQVMADHRSVELRLSVLQHEHTNNLDLRVRQSNPP